MGDEDDELVVSLAPDRSALAVLFDGELRMIAIEDGSVVGWSRLPSAPQRVGGQLGKDQRC